ncbi:unnamed protein product [Orchesella dallaii]|uniref:Protein SCAI n=1 Tax=Orchesella dallaii TaxID=48710 RepID=A0ABP1QWK9_9HEXA
MVSGRSSSGSSESSSVSFGRPALNNGDASAPPQVQQVDMTQLVATTNGQPENNHVLLTLQEKRVIAEFCHLLEKSKQLFNQLRELPPHGSSTTAALPTGLHVHSNGNNSCATTTSTSVSSFSCQQAYFSRAFDTYTRLWKYQQTHRNILDKKYGLKRWQIGDIASKIGQLYYHYYLRTSELSYLVEAANFYGAIRGRGYYARTSLSRRDSGTAASARSCRSGNTESSASGDSMLIVKKLRYYARFIIVSLLLRRNNVKDLLRELSGHVENYVATVDEEPEEQLEWNLVLSEIRSFIDADSPVDVYEGLASNGEKSVLEQLEQGAPGHPIILNHRLPRETIKCSRDKADVTTIKQNYKLQEVLIVGNKPDQLKFSELTIDMFRMMQTFERMIDDRSTPDSGDDKDAQELKNPHKYLLYRGTIEQILANLNAAWSELTWNGVLLVYISSEACLNSGIATVNNSRCNRTKLFDAKQHGEDNKEIHCLYPCDLLPLTRKPLVAIVDSDNSHVFLELGQQKESYGQPLVILASPEGSTSSSGDLICPAPQSSSNRGSIFTLFLHNPLAALCNICGVKAVSIQTWNQLETLLSSFFNEALDHIREESQHNSDWDVYVKLFGDDFLRLVILRYLFCHTVYSMHKDSQTLTLRPKSFPEVSLLNQDKIETNRFEELIFQMTDSIQSKNMFKRI